MSFFPASPLRVSREAAYTLMLPVGVGIAALLAWQIFARWAEIPQVILPAPTDVLAAFPVIGGTLAHHAVSTGVDAFIAFVLATLLGLIAAVVLSSSAVVFETFYPHVVLFQLIPKIALAPLFTFWLGIASPSRLTYAVFISFFPVTLTTMTGLARADVNALRLCRAVMASPWQTFFSVRIPYALPYFLTGVKVAATMSVIGIVVGEFISAKEGLGFYVLLASSRGETANVFAGLFVLCAIGLLLYALAAGLERLLRKWWRG